MQGFAHVSRPLRETVIPIDRLSSWRHRRDGHVSRARGAHQPARAPAARRRLEAARPLRDLHGEQRPLPRTCGAGERAGLYYTCINSYLTAEEVAYIVDNSESQVLITSLAKLPVAPRTRSRMCPRVKLLPRRRRRRRGAERRSAHRRLRRGRRRASRHADRRRVARHADAVFVGHHRPAERHPAAAARATPRRSRCRCSTSSNELWQSADGMIYLSPAPLYHSAPQATVGSPSATGGTAMIMEHFDPEQYLALVEQYRITHSSSCRRCSAAC